MSLIFEDTIITLELGTTGPQGPPGPAGTGGSQQSDPYPVAEPISALRVVAFDNSDALVLADSGTLAHAYRLVGLQQTAVSSGPATPLIRGIVTDAAWAWDTSKPIWLGNAGFLTQSPPTTGFQATVATPLTADTIHFEIQEITEL